MLWPPSDEEMLANFLKSEDAAVRARTLFNEELRKARKRGDDVLAEACRLGALKQTEALRWFRSQIRRLQAARSDQNSLRREFDRFDEACRFLGLTPPFNTDDYKAAYRAAARRHHPDHGGTTEQFLALTKACEVILSHGPRLRRDLGK